MASILEELLIKISVDVTGVKKNIESVEKGVDSLKKKEKDLTDNNKKLSDGFVSLGKSLLGFLGIAISASALKNLTTDTLNVGASINRLGKELNLSTEEIGTWAQFAKTFGGGIEDVVQSIGKFKKVQGDLLFGKIDPEYMNAMGLLGITFNKNSKASEIFIKQLDSLREYQKKYGIESANNIASTLGISKAFMDAVRSGKDLNQIYEESKKAGAIAQKNAESYDDLTQKIDAFKGRLKTLILNNETLNKGIRNATESLINFFEELNKGAESSNPIVIALTKIKDLTIMIVDGWKIIFQGWAKLFPYISKLGDNLSDGWNKIRYGKKENIENRKKDVEANINPNPSNNIKNSSTFLVRNVRNKNPGNLEFKGQKGAILEKGVEDPRFAYFKDYESGVEALFNQLKLYAKRGLTTIKSIISRYAPSNENNTESYIKNLEDLLGIDRDKNINFGDISFVKKLAEGIILKEGGKKSLDIYTPYLNDYVNKMGVIGQSIVNTTANTNNNGETTNIKNESNVGQVNIITQSSDADSIARGASDALRRQLLIMNMTGAVR